MEALKNFRKTLDSIPWVIELLLVIFFDGLYGKSGLSKVLTGSKSIKENGYNDKILASRYYGTVTGRSQKEVEAVIEELISENILTIKRISFGRPILYFNKKHKI